MLSCVWYVLVVACCLVLSVGVCCLFAACWLLVERWLGYAIM